MGLPLRVRPSLIITRMITNRIRIHQIKFWLFPYKMTTAVCQILRTLLLRKEKLTTSVTEWANASRQEFNNIERRRSDRQEAQKRRAREIFDHIVIMLYELQGWHKLWLMKMKLLWILLKEFDSNNIKKVGCAVSFANHSALKENMKWFLRKSFYKSVHVKTRQA